MYFTHHIKRDIDISSSLRLFLKCEFDADIKILQKSNHHDEEQQLIFFKTHVSKHTG